MPLPLPNLDTRRWADLVEEARGLIPRYGPGWTDHNAHDPGITLVELLASLVELDIYRLNRIPTAHRRKFLSLVGISPEPPRAARAVLGLAPPGPAAADLPAGAEFTATRADGGISYFRAVEPAHAVPSKLAALLVQAGPDDPPRDVTKAWNERGRVDALGADPAAGASLWLGFDAPWPAGPPVRLALHFGGERGGEDERRRLVEEAGARREDCRRPLPDPPPCADRAVRDEVPEVPTLPPHHDARVAWQLLATAGWKDLVPEAGHVDDETRSLTLDGAVTIRLPEDMAPFDPGLGRNLFFLRVTLARGDFDTPPQLAGVVVNAVRVEQAVPVVQAFPIRPGVEALGAAPPLPGPARVRLHLDPAGVIDALAFTTDDRVPEQSALAYQPASTSSPGLLALEFVPLGFSDGTPGQSFALPRAAVQRGSFELFTLEPPGPAFVPAAWRRWEVRPDFDASDGHDPHVRLDETEATITLGDGNRGRIPPRGTPLLARYRATDAGLGDARAGTIAALAPTTSNWMLFNPQLAPADLVESIGLANVVSAGPARGWQDRGGAGYDSVVGRLGTIIQPRPAAGGADAETLTHAEGRSALALQATTRAITADDYEELALDTPGTAIARARALPGRHPAFPSLSAPGVVTVIVVPDQRRHRPFPSTGLLVAVRRYLDRRRVLGTQVEVVGPSYVVVTVHARVQSLAGASPARVRADVLAALAAFLDPIRGGPAAIAPTRRADPATAPSTQSAPPIAPGVQLLAPAPTATKPLPAPPPAEPGWPFGRDVYRSEIMQVIAGVPGADHVLSLALSGDGGAPACGNVCVGPTQLVVSGPHSLEVI